MIDHLNNHMFLYPDRKSEQCIVFCEVTRFTNEHAQIAEDDDWEDIEEDEDGAAIIRFVFVITAFAASRNIPVDQIWSTDPTLGTPWLQIPISRHYYWKDQLGYF